MNWLKRFFGMDALDESPGADPSSVVHVATLPLWQTPLIVKGLELEGIGATFAEMSSPKFTMVGIPTAHVYVIERDRAAAEALIAELTAREPGFRRRRSRAGAEH